MAATPSTMIALGTEAPDFSLPNVDGTTVSRDDFKEAKALLVIFVCNHCPFVVHVKDEIGRVARDYAGRGVALVAINANDVDEYPQDSPDNMRMKAEEWGWTFPYLYDESQDVAKAYRAACTPDFFLFDAERRLAYRGQLDDSRPGNAQPVNGADLRRALDAVLAGEKPGEEQKASVGCNIKWKPGSTPEYA
ncbi:MAG: thioredoxin family protein [Armatimonadetes bacterium]|nr:thioredoxin family protein [Armatimonadota bacterium]